jgi:VWFA-related protein
LKGERVRNRCLILALGAVLVWSSSSGAQDPPPEQPTFRATTERVVIDAAVVDQAGRPITDVTAAEFDLKIDGKPRGLVSVEFLPHLSEPATPAPSTGFTPFSSNERAQAGRLVLIAIDQNTISIGRGRTAFLSATALLDRLAPEDRVGIVAFPRGPKLEFTADRKAVDDTLQQVIGTAQHTLNEVQLSPTEVLSITRGDNRYLGPVIDRECQFAFATDADPLSRQQEMATCRSKVEQEARSLAILLREQTTASLNMLRAVVTQLKRIPAPKTLVWVSQGMLADDRRPDIARLADEALAARVNIYVLHLDPPDHADASAPRVFSTFVEDREMMSEGLEFMAGVGRGALFRTTGNAEFAFTQIANELAGSYLLTIEPQPSDRDGRTHDIDLKVRRAGAIVRSRHRFAVTPAPRGPSAPEEQITALLRAPLLAAELPLKLATYSLARGDKGRVRVMLGAELGGPASAPDDVALGFVVTDQKGKVVGDGYQQARLGPMVTGVASPLQYNGLIELAPGNYKMRFAAVDGSGRQGSLEHRFEVALTSRGGLTLGSLVLAPLNSDRGLRAPARATVAVPFQAYADLRVAAGVALEAVRVRVEVTDRTTGEVLTTADGQVLPGSDSKGAAAQARLPVELVPPGAYDATLVVNAGDAEPVRLSRPFDLMTAVAPGKELFADDIRHLPASGNDALLVPAYVTPVLEQALAVDGASADAATREAIAAWIRGAAAAEDTLPKDPESGPLLSTTMARGIARLRRGDLEPAAAAFRAAIKIASDFPPAAVYLGACYAAGGRDREAAGAWQLVLALGQEDAVIYRLTADALLRLGDAAAADDVLKDAVRAFPQDPELTRRVALARASAGDAAEALDLIEPLLAGGSAEPDVEVLAVKLAIALAAGNTTSDHAGDLARLQRYSRLLAHGREQPPPLIAQWIRHLEGAAPASTQP